MSNTAVEVHRVESDADYQACMWVRRVVFIEEQQCDEADEYDGLDDVCVHFAASVGTNVVGTCRLRQLGAFIKLERVAVLLESRKHGVGRALNEAAFAYAKEHYPTLLLMAHAQMAVLDFYGRQGMVPVSDVFYEVGIPHKTVILIPPVDRIPALNIWKDTIEDAGHTGGVGDESDDETVIENMKRLLKDALQQVECCDCLPPLSELARLCAEKEVERVIGRSLRILFEKCVAATTEKRFDESASFEKVLLDYSWEKLNTGHYSQVNECWRMFYAAANACKSVRCFWINDLTV
uniref:N-acetyltransferase domain-containing protein n=1 Tax=Plectus sambesii TaxID=2011161 RepID=A0A914V5L9_9BILA